MNILNKNIENKEEYFKSLWLPFFISLGLSIVQSIEISFTNIFFDIDYLQLADTFTICIYAAIIPVRFVFFIDNPKKTSISHFIIWFLGVGLYILYSFTEFKMNFIFLIISLFLGIISFAILRIHLTKKEEEIDEKQQ